MYLIHIRYQYARYKIAQPTTSWLEDYFDWIQPQDSDSCCRVYNDSGHFCPSTGTMLSGRCNRGVMHYI